MVDFPIKLQNVTWPSKYATPYTLATVLSLSPAFQLAGLERPRHSHLQRCFYGIKCLTPQHSRNLIVSFLPTHLPHPASFDCWKGKGRPKTGLETKAGPKGTRPLGGSTVGVGWAGQQSLLALPNPRLTHLFTQFSPQSISSQC